MADDGAKSSGISLIYRSRAEILAEAQKGPKATLSFEFLAELSPFLPIEQVIETFGHVLATTTVRPEVHHTLLPLWLHGHLEGNTRYERAAFAPLLDDEISFRWPWFDEHRTKFRSSVHWPDSWKPFAELAKDKRLGLRTKRVTLLLSTIGSTVLRRREAQQYSVGSYDRWGWSFFSTCEVSLQNAQQYLPSPVLGDWRTYPPYFPGDNTTIRRNFRHSA